jgi:two-component system, chemotaxis family, chemotaxis protein CheY
LPRAVLIVDDSPTIRGFARLCLKPLQIEVKEAQDGAEALTIVRAAPPALAIVDLNMPGMGGLAFTREVRADKRPEIAQMPVVLLTGDRLDTVREQGRAAGATDFLGKPLKAPDLVALVKKFLGLA